MRFHGLSKGKHDSAEGAWPRCAGCDTYLGGPVWPPLGKRHCPKCERGRTRFYAPPAPGLLAVTFSLLPIRGHSGARSRLPARRSSSSSPGVRRHQGRRWRSLSTASRFAGREQSPFNSQRRSCRRWAGLTRGTLCGSVSLRSYCSWPSNMAICPMTGTGRAGPMRRDRVPRAGRL